MSRSNICKEKRGKKKGENWRDRYREKEIECKKENRGGRKKVG